MELRLRPLVGRLTPSDLALPLMGGVVAGVALTTWTDLTLLAAGAICGLVLLLVACWRFPHRALYVCTAAILLGGMKFRKRAATDVLTGSVDNQIVFELAVYAAVGLATCVAAVALGLHRRRMRSAEWVLVGYTALALASVAWSRSPALSATRAVQLVVLTVLLLSIFRADTPARILRVVAGIYTTFVVVAATLAFLAPGAAGGTVDFFTGGQRFGWFADHPITVAMHAGVAALLLLSALSYTRQKPRPPTLWVVGGLLASAFCGVVIVMTGSRGPAGALVLVGGLLLAARFLRPAHAFGLTLILGIIVAAFSLFPSSPRVVAQTLDLESSPMVQFALRGAPLEHFAAFGGRLELWNGAMQVVRESPLVGQGFVASRAALLEVVPWGGHAHNGPLQSLLDLGLLGMALLWIAVFVQLTRFLLSSPRDADAGRVRLWVIGILSFLILASVTDPGLAGPPGALPMLGFMVLLVPVSRGIRG